VVIGRVRTVVVMARPLRWLSSAWTHALSRAVRGHHPIRVKAHS
jgi:hypothetical protein